MKRWTCCTATGTSFTTASGLIRSSEPRKLERDLPLSPNALAAVSGSASGTSTLSSRTMLSDQRSAPIGEPAAPVAAASGAAPLTMPRTPCVPASSAGERLL